MQNTSPSRPLICS